MENEIVFDFDRISGYEDFYRLFRAKTNAPEWFGDSLDALFDFIGGDMKLPVHLKLINLNLEQIETFENLLETLEDAENEIKGFTFSYYMEQFDDFDSFDKDELSD